TLGVPNTDSGSTNEAAIQETLDTIPALAGKTTVKTTDGITYTIQFDKSLGNVSPLISSSPDQATTDTLLDGSSGAVTVTGQNGGPFTLTFGGGLSGRDASPIVSTDPNANIDVAPVGFIGNFNGGLNGLTVINGASTAASTVQTVVR